MPRAQCAIILQIAETEVYRFDVKGHTVLCYETDGDRLWRCECERFKRFGEGFCRTPLLR
jgi:hypothetical protein